MSASDNMERVLRDIHVMIAKCPKYNNSNEQVVVDRKELLAHLDRLNHSVYEMMEQYEQTAQSRASAEREIKRRGDGIIENASAKAEDVYAAAVLYTADMLGRIQNILDDAQGSVRTMMEGFEQEIKGQKKIIRSNQTELESQLNDMHDTQKYLRLIQDVNKEIQKEKERKARIKAMGVRKATELEADEDSDIVIHTDSEYFKQKQEEEAKAAEEAETVETEEAAEAEEAEIVETEEAAEAEEAETVETEKAAETAEAAETPEAEAAEEELTEEVELPPIEIDDELFLDDIDKPEESEESEESEELSLSRAIEQDLARTKEDSTDIEEELEKAMEEKPAEKENNIEDLLEAQLLADVEWIDSLQK